MLKAIPILLLTIFLVSCNNNIKNKTDIVDENKHHNQFEHNENIKIEKKQDNFLLDKTEEKMLNDLMDF